MPPPCFLLSIKAEQFELGEGLSANAENNLVEACSFAGRLLSNPDLDFWLKQVTFAARYRSEDIGFQKFRQL